MTVCGVRDSRMDGQYATQQSCRNEPAAARFTYGLFNDAVGNVMNWKGCSRKRACPTSKPGTSRGGKGLLAKSRTRELPKMYCRHNQLLTLRISVLHTRRELRRVKLTAIHVPIATYRLRSATDMLKPGTEFDSH